MIMQLFNQVFMLLNALHCGRKDPKGQGTIKSKPKRSSYLECFPFCLGQMSFCFKQVLCLKLSTYRKLAPSQCLFPMIRERSEICSLVPSVLSSTYIILYFIYVFVFKFYVCACGIHACTCVFAAMCMCGDKRPF